jgi:3-oxoacyl-[acyl-carrier protein] reductase
MYIGKTVLITGGNKGIGKIIADHLSLNGARVIAPERALMDVSNPRDILFFMNQLDEAKERVDILINNAAVLTSQYSTKMSWEDAKAMVDTDLLGAFVVAKETVKLMKRSEHGRIINISSMAVVLEPMGDSMYAACKAGLTTMSNIMAKEFAFMGITVNTLAISAIETDMLKQLNKEKIDKVVGSLPIPRYAKAEDITNVIDFFASERSEYITAQTIYLGGVHA